MGKTIRLLSLVLALLLCLCACGDEKPRETVSHAGYAEESTENERFLMISTNLPDGAEPEITVKNQDNGESYTASRVEDTGAWMVLVNTEGLYEITVKCSGYKKTETALRVGENTVYCISVQCQEKT